MAREGAPRITVIDDHAEFLGLMRQLLSGSYDVRTFTGRDISPDDILDSNPDLLIVDLRLDTRDLQGWDVVRLVRAHRHLRAIPIVVCSADHGALRERSAAMSAANVASLAKPFELEALEALIQRGLSDGFAGDAPAAVVASNPLPAAVPAPAAGS
jgi:DNA-binding response OmpR family regulator